LGVVHGQIDASAAGNSQTLEIPLADVLGAILAVNIILKGI
jgi:hypothetical protein